MRKPSPHVVFAVIAASWLVGLATPVASLAGGSLSTGTTAGELGKSSCPKGAAQEEIGGGTVCLSAGAPCQATLAADYPAWGFVCVRARLSALPSPKKLKLPPAAALPSSSVRITLPARGAWSQGITNFALTSGALWVSSGVFRIDSKGNAVAGPFDSGESQNICAGDGGIWASDSNSGLVRRFNPATGKLVATIELGTNSNPEGITTTTGAVWVAENQGGVLARIDPRTNRVVARVRVTSVGSSGPQGIASGLGSVWVDVPNINEVVRVNPVTNAIVARIVIGNDMTACGGIAVGRTAVWVSSCLDGTRVGRIDPATNLLASIMAVGGDVMDIASDGDDAWFVASGNPVYSPNKPAYLLEVSAHDTVVRRIAVGQGFITGGVELAFGSIWIGDWAKPLVVRIPG